MTRASLWLALGVALAAMLSIAAGKVWGAARDAWTAADPRSIIIVELRLPRTVLAIVVGAALGLSGAVMQGYLRNPLADPGLFGVSSGAALGVVLSLYFGYAAQAWLLPGFALAGGGDDGAAGADRRALGQPGPGVAGLILTSIAGSMTSLAISLAPTPFVADRDLAARRADRSQLGRRGSWRCRWSHWAQACWRPPDARSTR
ncbi:iron chelate uptake ABC transporter family permease subunit [Sphingomonas sp. MMS24-JH45]